HDRPDCTGGHRAGRDEKTFLGQTKKFVFELKQRNAHNLKRREIRAFGRVSTPAFPKRSPPRRGTRIRSDRAHPCGFDHAPVDWDDLSFTNPIWWRPCVSLALRRPRTEASARRGKDVANRGLTETGPLQKGGQKARTRKRRHNLSLECAPCPRVCGPPRLLRSRVGTARARVW